MPTNRVTGQDFKRGVSSKEKAKVEKIRERLVTGTGARGGTRAS